MKKLFSKVAIIGVFLGTLAGGQGFSFAQSQSQTRYFPETKQSISGRFLEYWTQNGGLMQQGYPISPMLEEQSAIDGKTYDVQYFERAVFEMHPENPRPNDVLLSLLGVLAYRQRYPNSAPNQVPNNDPGSIYFPETGKRLGDSFLTYFKEHGGIPQQGLPISGEFQETSPLDGKTRTVQYFERAVFEWNPSNRPPYNVLLSQLGTFAYKAKNSTPPVPTPVIPLPEPVIPGPLRGGQYSPVGSDHYLVWEEGTMRSDSGPIYGSFDVRALDLRTNNVITVTDAPGDQRGASLDGDLVAWQSTSPNPNCTGCPEPGVYAKDLSTGKDYTVATGFVPYATIGVSGRKVAWQEGGTTSQRIKAKDLDTNKVTLVKEIAIDKPYITDLQMSGNFLVWNEISYNSSGIHDQVSHLWAYDLTTSKTTDVLSYYVVEGAGTSLPNYALSGHRVIVQDPQSSVFVKDLASNISLELDYKGLMDDVVMTGDIVLFSSNPDITDINGINLNRPNKVVPIIESVPGSWNRYQFTIAGGRLVYVNTSSYPNRKDPIQLQVAPLPDALR